MTTTSLQSSPCLSAFRDFQYRSMAALERTVCEEEKKAAAKGAGDTRIVFHNVPGHIIEQLDAQEKTHIHYFDKRNNFLEIIVPFEYHELACVLGEKMIEGALARVHQADAFKQERATRKYDSAQGQGKEADSAFTWRPAHRPKAAPANWPPIVLEVGASQSTRDLRADCRWWHEHSNGAVRVVVMIEVHGGHGTRVRIAVSTIGSAPGVLDYRGEIIADLVDGGHRWAFEEEGPISIPFEAVFLRSADASACEEDLEILGSDFLQYSDDLREALLTGIADRSPSPSPTEEEELPLLSAERVRDPYNLRDLPGV